MGAPCVACPTSVAAAHHMQPQQQSSPVALFAVATLPQQIIPLSSAERLHFARHSHVPPSHLPNLPLQELPADLTAEQACSPVCSELVGTMLLSNLVALSHLDDAGPQQVGGRVPAAAGKQRRLALEP